MRKTATEKRADQLLDILISSDTNVNAVRGETGWSSREFSEAVRALRDRFAASGDTITVTAEPNGHRRRWVYGLRGGSMFVDAEKSRWVENRLRDTERRVRTIVNVLKVAQNATDGRTITGRKVRIYLLHLTRAREEVEMLVSGDALT